MLEYKLRPVLIMSTFEEKSQKTPKRLRKGLILDGIHPRDWRELKITYCCEMCSHFDSHNIQCTIGYDCRPHLRENQDHLYHLTGKVAFCRFLEID